MAILASPGDLFSTNEHRPTPDLPRPTSSPPSSGRGGLPSIARIQIASTTDREVAASAFGRVYAEGRLETTGQGPFQCEMDAVVFGPVKSVRGSWSARTTLKGGSSARQFGFALGLIGQFTGIIGSAPFEVVPGRRAMVFSPDHDFLLDAAMPVSGRTLVFDAALVHDHLRLLTGRDAPRAFEFDGPLSFGEDAPTSLFTLAGLFEEEMRRPDPSPLWLLSLRDSVLTGLLVHARHSATKLFTAPPLRVAQSCVRRAEEFISAHANDPITLADIVAAAGVPERSLRAAFRASRGRAPMEALRQHRMELARDKLLAPSAETTVAQVVSALGFGNPGRFSLEYRKRFLESPSETLERGLALAGLSRRRPR